jgi:hypothetical protein
MIERLSDVPDGVIGFETVGAVHAEDYRRVVHPAFEELAASGRPARVLLLVGPRFERFSAGAMWEDAKTGLEHVHWDRAALVTDVDWMLHLTSAFGWMVPGDFRTFALDDLDAAKAWLSPES